MGESNRRAAADGENVEVYDEKGIYPVRSQTRSQGVEILLVVLDQRM